MILQAEPLTFRTAIMPSNTAASMFGGAGGRGSKASVSSPQGLRNMLRKDERDHPAADQATPTAPGTPAHPDAPADDKHTLRGLNDRLSGYLGKVKRLEKENADLEREIDEILAKRKTPEGRDWAETEKPLEELKKQVGHQTFCQIQTNSGETSSQESLFCDVLLCLGEGHHHGQRQVAAAD